MSEQSRLKAAVFDALPAEVALIDSEGVILTVNDSWRSSANANHDPASVFGVGQNYLKIYDDAGEQGGAEAAEVAAGIRGVLLSELGEFGVEYAFQTRGEQRWVRILVSPTGRYRSQGALVTHQDITQQKIQELKRQRREERYLLLLNSTTEGIFAIEARGVCTFCNQAAAHLLGYENADQVIGKVVHRWHPQTDPHHTPYLSNGSMINRGIWVGEGSHGNEVFLRLDGTEFPVEYWSRPIHRNSEVVGAVVTFLDITEQKRLETQFLQAQKMEAVGHLAGGIAHDFKNALSVIVGYSQLIEERLLADAEGRKYAQQIGVAAERAAAFTRQLLGFSHKHLLRPVALNLNSVLNEMEKMLRRIIGEDVKLTLILAPNLPTVEADPGLIEQALMNLIVNARDAMPKGGELIIRTSIREAGGYVTISVSDSGCGMDEVTQSRIFEPFFTTKDPGKGTGLGLSTVYKIVKQCGGHIFVHSEPGCGSDFTIYLPIVEGPAQPAISQMARQALWGSETILVIEDEEALRTLISDTLRSNGYSVLEAQDGTAGIEIAEGCHKQVDLVLTDVMLPDIDGVWVAQKLNTASPLMEVLYMSGYSDDYIISRGIHVPEARFLEKPFELRLMLMAVRKALDGRITSSGPEEQAALSF